MFLSPIKYSLQLDIPVCINVINYEGEKLQPFAKILNQRQKKIVHGEEMMDKEVETTNNYEGRWN